MVYGNWKLLLEVDIFSGIFVLISVFKFEHVFFPKALAKGSCVYSGSLFLSFILISGGLRNHFFTELVRVGFSLFVAICNTLR